tara:strand:+ start:3163 stop:3807 length:645 start_codon:yes stop_codon:yes gene_type:complete
MDELFISTKIKSSLSVDPRNINNSINRTILKKIKNDIEGKCIKNGFVRKNSVKLIKRSLGETLTSQFNGSVIYHVEYLVDLCNPLEGASIECEVLNINKMGVLAGIQGDIDSPLNILLARQHHINNQDFEDIRENDLITIRVLGKRFEYGDNQISIIGLLESEFSKQNEENEKNDSDDEENLELLSNNEPLEGNTPSLINSSESEEPDVDVEEN